MALRQAQVCAAAREAGITLEPDRIEVLPNTVLAHRLIRYARQAGGEAAASALIDWLFEGYFLRGEDLGDPRVLHAAAIACACRCRKRRRRPLRKTWRGCRRCMARRCRYPIPAWACRAS
ncbi:disulfide oxidoreductase [Cupriavidus necator N-1]|uniref:Disulfide oxidoreductase n=1 Tax=Cupriavidus necator (strain ATCC 43291 / DSM 13513 / CCUG 52238 / LMG 8453 / N-1) TaxID=1042878 RepID=F8GME7_CUPNN|nr:disulfide oxidoreductase [Cupriavidus necator N-1]KAI3611562.1 2-hydroxychromene-2-carboxylate isomerase/DsbA-like thioredoxin domain [Cupriavidus necator H850]